MGPLSLCAGRNTTVAWMEQKGLDKIEVLFNITHDAKLYTLGLKLKELLEPRERPKRSVFSHRTTFPPVEVETLMR